MTANDDSAPVRQGEEVDSAALEKYLSANLPNHLSEPGARIEVRQFPGGHSNLTYLIRYGALEFVLRRPPVGPVAPTAHDMPREYRLLSVINPRFPLAPEPVLLCEDLSIIGVPFYLMERRRGQIIRNQMPLSFEEDPTLRRRLSEGVVDTLVALHQVDIESSGIVAFGKPAGFVMRQVRGWADRWQRSKTNELPAMEEVITWLGSRIPAERLPEARIVHNDFKLDNIVLDSQDPTRVVAVLDWEMCAVGDPLIDVGLFLSYWTMKGSGDQNTSLRAITTGPGWLTREEIIQRYSASTNRDLSQIAFYETFARFKVAVVVQQIYFRYVKGQTSDPRFRDLNLMVSELSKEALKLARSSGI
jgi:aminoglycoside phosphotransferase (APT) family kinase protein